MSQNMPSKKQILKHWKEQIPDIDDTHCWSCGLKGKLERCHIEPVRNGGKNNASNLHILCNRCHTDSEYFYGQDYWLWFKNRRKFRDMYENLYKSELVSLVNLFQKESDVTELLEKLLSK